MKKIFTLIVIEILFLQGAFSQGVHFSQYYNAPLLINPANTGMLPDNDYRVGIQFRNQGATIPIPYNTFSAFADVGIGRAKWENSWLGLGGGVWRDVAGDGQLALTKIQGNIAYHVLTSENSSLSLGLSYASNQRSVDFSKLTFDVQWDEFAFDRSAPNLEGSPSQKSSFNSAGAGVGFGYFNNNDLYLKASLGIMNMNRPIETFYGQSNRLGVRPNAQVDVIYKASARIMLNPSVYYARQKKASELMLGSLVNINTSIDGTGLSSNEVILGAFYRNNDAIVGVAGFKIKNNRFMVNYDHTISQLSKGNGGVGAFEFSLILQGNYRKDDGNRKIYGCPRF
jgi:type IX secretion system PorP/SprF family membrane protein